MEKNLSTTNWLSIAGQEENLQIFNKMARKLQSRCWHNGLETRAGSDKPRAIIHAQWTRVQARVPRSPLPPDLANYTAAHGRGLSALRNPDTPFSPSRSLEIRSSWYFPVGNYKFPPGCRNFHRWHIFRGEVSAMEFIGFESSSFIGDQVYGGSRWSGRWNSFHWFQAPIRAVKSGGNVERAPGLRWAARVFDQSRFTPRRRSPSAVSLKFVLRGSTKFGVTQTQVSLCYSFLGVNG